MTTDASRRKLISIVTPCYNEAENVEECHRAIRELFDGELADFDFEHIFSDNASTDTTPEILKRMAAADRRVKVILNARNFGPFRSDFNGLLRAKGDAVLVLFAADQQDPPDVLPEMVRRWQEGYEVVYGIRANREDRCRFATRPSTFRRRTRRPQSDRCGVDR